MKESFKNISLEELIIDNKEYIYPALFYMAGLFLGSYSFSLINNSAVSRLIEKIFSSSSDSLYVFFINRFSLYFSVYLVCVLLGMCLIGFPIINIIPFLTGCEIAIKTAYYYVNSGFKGVGFALLMIIPEGAAIATVLIHAIKTSSLLSKSIFDVAGKGKCERIEIKAYLKEYLFYGVIVALIAFFNSLASFLLNSIIKI